MHAEGHTLRTLPVDRSDARTFGQRFWAALSQVDALVVAGGDGTVHHALPSILNTGVPIYHLPLGTENLFARQFGMTLDSAKLAGALAMPILTAIDVAHVSVEHDKPNVPEWNRRFCIMASIGPDASVVRRLAAVRNGPISHARYARPILAELRAPWLPRMDVWVDGQQIVQAQRGMLVIANSRHYAVRIDPARNAMVDDGLLDAVFMPARTGIEIGLWLARARTRTHLASDGRAEGAVEVRGSSIRVELDDASPACQMDGEHVPVPSPLAMTVRVEPRVLRVLRVPQTIEHSNADQAKSSNGSPT